MICSNVYDNFRRRKLPKFAFFLLVWGSGRMKGWMHYMACKSCSAEHLNVKTWRCERVQRLAGNFRQASKLRAEYSNLSAYHDASFPPSTQYNQSTTIRRAALLTAKPMHLRKSECCHPKAVWLPLLSNFRLKQSIYRLSLEILLVTS
jgi:hypothetical protein